MEISMKQIKANFSRDLSRKIGDLNYRNRFYCMPVKQGKFDDVSSIRDRLFYCFGSYWEIGE
jgi:hypothetical protein